MFKWFRTAESGKREQREHLLCLVVEHIASKAQNAIIESTFYRKQISDLVEKHNELVILVNKADPTDAKSYEWVAQRSKEVQEMTDMLTHLNEDEAALNERIKVYLELMEFITKNMKNENVIL